MQSVPREWLDFLRQQFPKDSRIQLTEIGGNPRPISPDSTGKLDYIDDAGQFHVKWDNGCTLALVLGEDRFSVYLPEPQTFKLYMPLTADFYGRDEWGDMSEDGEEWDGHTLMDYEGQILSALVKNRVPEENESGLMRWYLDAFISQVREAYGKLELFGPEHCEPNSYESLDYEGRVLVLSPDTLKESCWTPQNQLWPMTALDAAPTLSVGLSAVPAWAMERRPDGTAQTSPAF